MVGFSNVLLPANVTVKLFPVAKSKAIEAASVRVTGIPTTCPTKVASVIEASVMIAIEVSTVLAETVLVNVPLEALTTLVSIEVAVKVLIVKAETDVGTSSL